MEAVLPGAGTEGSRLRQGKEAKEGRGLRCTHSDLCSVHCTLTLGYSCPAFPREGGRHWL